MNESSDKWGLTILAAHSQRWSQRLAEEFRDGVSSLLTDVERRMRIEHPSLHLQPLYLAAGNRGTSQVQLVESVAFAILDVTDYDEDLAFLVGLMQGARIPYIGVCRSESEIVIKRQGFRAADVIPYNEIAELFSTDTLLHQHISQAISQARVLEQLVYELWFPRDTTTIWVVCPQCHDPGEFAERSSPDYTYLDNLGDTDALLEIMVFLSRYYPKASIEKFSSDDLPTGHTRNNIVVVGGPGSCEDISNRVCLEMMGAVKSRVSYTEDCERMVVTLDDNESLELRAELRSDVPDPTPPDYFNMRRDYGYFARFPNPLDEGATVILTSGIHTAGVLGAARAFADGQEALRNYHSVFNSNVNPRSFECHFEVSVLNGNVRIPSIPRDNIYSLGLRERAVPDTPCGVGESQLDVEKDRQVTVLFIAGDRGGVQRNQIQIPREFDSIQNALRGCEHRDAICLATPILAATHQKLVEAYRHRPDILHFAGHGDDRSLSFISDQGLLVSQARLIAEQLSSILLNFPERIRLCVLNTCDSATVAKHLVDTHATEAAIGWPGKLSDMEAIGFSGAFYGRLGDGLKLSQSVTLAAKSLNSEETPMLYMDEGVDLDVIYVYPKG